jgi:hypothetical protein
MLTEEVSRNPSTRSSAAVATLVVATVFALGWAVVGKHRLDPRARLLYKATRIVLAESPCADVEPPPAAASDPVPTNGVGVFELVHTACAVHRPPCLSSRTACRSPPRA